MANHAKKSTAIGSATASRAAWVAPAVCAILLADEAVEWRYRTPQPWNDSGFSHVGKDGNPRGGDAATSETGVCPCFSI